jgi:hypothetical protein
LAPFQLVALGVRDGDSVLRAETHRVSNSLTTPPASLRRGGEPCAAGILSNGRLVYVEGLLTTRQYEAKDGSGKRYRTEVVARQLCLLGNRANDNASKAEASDDISF